MAFSQAELYGLAYRMDAALNQDSPKRKPVASLKVLPQLAKTGRVSKRSKDGELIKQLGFARNKISDFESKHSKSGALQNIDEIVKNLKKPGLVMPRDLNSFRHNRDFFGGHLMSD